ncbi:MAG: bifunctional tetrahydrofolate synthase/dihydrofolate synthase [Enterovibrio sp.]
MSNLCLLDANSSLDLWLDHINSIHSSAIDLGLSRVAAVAQRAKLTAPAPKVITVAGTNGKGSTCAIIEAVLQKSGYKTGVYSSPHLIKYNERVRIDGKIIDDAALCQAFAAIEELRGDTSLSFFEFGTLAALWLFKAQQVDVAILEVGLGGRLDATNVVDPDVAVITTLALDHVDWLGSDIAQIGLEKAGIFRSQKPAVCGEASPPASVAGFADEIGAKLYQVGYQFDYEVQGDSWRWRSGAFELTDLPIPALPLANAATALMAIGLSGLEVTDEDIVFALKNARLPGRMQQISKKPIIILDVAHNPHSAHYLALQMKELKARSGAKLSAVVGMLKDKDLAGTLNELRDVIDSWYLCSLSGERAAKWPQLAQHLTYLEQAKVKGFDSPTQAFWAAKEELSLETDAIVVFGSFHTVGEIAGLSMKME